MTKPRRSRTVRPVRKPTHGRKANYRGTAPEQAAEAVLRSRPGRDELTVRQSRTQQPRIKPSL